MCYQYHTDLIWSATFDERRANDSNVCWTKLGCVDFLDAVVPFCAGSCHYCPSTTLNWRSRTVQTRMQIKTCISRYDNGAYIRIQFLRAASYSVATHSALVHEINCDLEVGRRRWRHDWCRRRSGRDTDSGWSTAERRLLGVLSSCVEQVKQQQLTWTQTPALSHGKPDGVAVVLTRPIRLDGWIFTARPSVCLSVTFMNCDHIFLVK